MADPSDRLPMPLLTAAEACAQEASRLLQQIVRAKQEWELTFDAIPDPVLVLDDQCAIRRANKAAAALFRLSPQQIVGRHCYEVLHGSAEPRPDCPHQRLLQSGVDQRGDIHEPRLGKTFAVTASPLRTSRGEAYGCVRVLHDITDRKRTEQALLESEERFRLLVGAVKDYAIFMLDPSGRVMSWNAGAQRIKGYAAEEVIGRHFSCFYRPQDIEADLPGHALRVGAAEGRFETQGWRRRKDGSEFWANVVLTALRDPQGGLLGFSKITRDLTERRQADEALRRVHRALQTLSQTNEAIVRARNEAELLHRVCDVLVRAGGYRLAWVGSAEHDESKTVRSVAQAGDDGGYVASARITWADTERGRGPVGVAIRTGRPCVIRNTTADPAFAPWRTEAAKRGYASVIGLPLIAGSHVFGVLAVYAAEPDAFDEDEVRLLTRLADDLAYGLVTICGRLEHARADEDRIRLSMAVEQAAESIIITDPGGIIVYVNPAFLHQTGYSREEVIGKSARLLDSGKRSEEFFAILWETLQCGEVWSGNLTGRRKDGSLYEEVATISPVRDAAGRVINLVSVQRDVTRERQLEQQLRHAQKMEAVGRLAGGIAHDFNNLLTAINGYTELLLSSGAEEPLRRYGEEIQKAGERAALLTRQLLAFSRQQILEPQIVDLNAVVTSMEKILRRVIGEDIELKTVLDPALGRIKADPGQIGQVIMNLAVNSRDAMPQGGKLTIETANVDLDTSKARTQGLAVSGSCVLLSVCDTGCGMSPETQAHIFEPFFTTKELGKGTGLGLATVYGIVAQSGGAIQCVSEINHGTLFRVYLPRVDGVAERPAPQEASRADTGGTETILLVEDEDSVRQLVRGVLGARGYAVLEATHGEEALAIADGHRGPLHLLLTDVVMPRMSGPELAARLRSRHGAMKVLFISGYTDDAIVHHGVREANAAYLQKPFSPDTLLNKVRHVLDAVNVSG